MSFPLGSSNLDMAGVSLDCAVTDNVHFSTGIDWVGFRYDRSPTNVYGMYEPDSRTDDISLKVGVGYAFRDRGPDVSTRSKRRERPREPADRTGTVGWNVRKGNGAARED